MLSVICGDGNWSRRATVRLGIDTLIANILVFTVARDRDSDSERLLYFGRVIYFFFRPPNFRRPWADFRENLPHDAVCAEIVYLL